MPKPFSVVSSIPYCAASAFGKLGAGDHAELDDRLAQSLARHLLLRQRTLEIVAGQQTLLDEQPSEGAPGDVGRFHELTIGRVALSDKTAARNASNGVGPCVGMR